MLKDIVIKGAKENNLKSIDVTIPRDKMVVLTGLSGSGKSSLAFDTIYAEGQRKYMESLSSYARQFLGQMEKPNVDYIEGAVAGHFHRSEDNQQKSQVHSGNGNGNIRLSQAYVRPHRNTSLPCLRKGNIQSDHRSDSGNPHVPGRGDKADGYGACSKAEKGSA